MSEYLPEGKLINTPQNRAVTHSLRLLREAVKKKTILEARAGLCDASHNLCVQLGGIRGMIPREEGALGMRDGTVRDIAVISRVNRPVCFTVTAVDEDSEGLPYALLSRADAQERCRGSPISKALARLPTSAAALRRSCPSTRSRFRAFLIRATA